MWLLMETGIANSGLLILICTFCAKQKEPKLGHFHCLSLSHESALPIVFVAVMAD